MACYKTLATAVLKAQEIREASYVRGEDIVTIGGRMPHGEYTKSHYDAAEEVAPDDPDTATLVYLLNATCWNDIQDWANNIINRKT